LSFNPATDRRFNTPAGSVVQGRARIAAPVADMRAVPDPGSGIDTQLLFGAHVRVFDEMEGWAFVQAEADGYCGWVAAAALGSPEQATHRLAVPRSFIYPGPDMKHPCIAALSMGSVLAIAGEAETRGTRYALMSDGTAVIAAHLAPVDAALVGGEPADPVSVAETLLNTPYLWGGASAFGIDCSGLVQLAHAMCGVALPRDTDMLAALAGEACNLGSLRRGDLVLWRGHVAMARGDGSIIHASGASMSVTIESLDAATARIAPLYGPPTMARRVTARGV
jgi:cell wall-associated NlpC family hydrolase